MQALIAALFIGTGIVFCHPVQAVENAATSPDSTVLNPFYGSTKPAPNAGSFRMGDYIICGGSVTKGDDGRYYMFASRWRLLSWTGGSRGIPWKYSNLLSEV